MAPWSVLDALEIVASSSDEPTALVQMLDRITTTARDTIPRTDYASIIVWYADEHLEPFASTDRVAAAVDSVACESHQGPCYDALTRGQIVVAGDLSQERRWPAYASQAALLGVRSQLAMRVHDGRRSRVGLNLYSRDRAAFPHPVEAAGVLVEYAGGLLTSLGDLRRIRGVVDGTAYGIKEAFPEESAVEASGTEACRSHPRPVSRRARTRSSHGDSGGRAAGRRG